MSRYINVDKFAEDARLRLCKDCHNDNGRRCFTCWVDDMLDEIEDAPTADVVEVRNGHWKHSTKEVGVELYHRWQCSECGRTVARLNESDVEDLPYCHCGAKMDGERKEL